MGQCSSILSWFYERENGANRSKLCSVNTFVPRSMPVPWSITTLYYSTFHMYTELKILFLSSTRWQRMTAVETVFGLHRFGTSSECPVLNPSPPALKWVCSLYAIMTIYFHIIITHFWHQQGWWRAHYSQAPKSSRSSRLMSPTDKSVMINWWSINPNVDKQT
jgi:hypothetical protein